MNRRIALLVGSIIFAIPVALCADDTKPTTIPSTGRGYLGLSVGKRRQNYIFSNGSYAVAGLMVRRIQSGSPASGSQLQLGDVIHEADGRSVDEEEPKTFIDWISTLPPGRVITLGVNNEMKSPPGERRKVQVTVGDRFNSGELARVEGDQVETIHTDNWVRMPVNCWPIQIQPYYLFRTPPVATPLPAVGSGFLGIALHPPNPLEVRLMGYPSIHLFDIPQIPGVIVEDVLIVSPAARADVRGGDIIVAIDGRRLTVADRQSFVQEIAAMTPGTAISLTIWRGGAWPPDVKHVQATIEARPPPESLLELKVKLNRSRRR